MATRIWKGSTGSWIDGAQWLPGGVPVSGDSVFVGAGTLTLSGLSIQSEALTVSGSGQEIFNIANTVFDANSSLVNAPSSTSSVLIYASGSVEFGGGVSNPQGDLEFLVKAGDVANQTLKGAINLASPNFATTSVSLTAGSVFDNEGIVTLSSNRYAPRFSETNTGTVINNGTVSISGARPDFTSAPTIASFADLITGTGSLLIGSSGELDIAGAGAGQTINFVTNGGTLRLGSSALTGNAVQATITHFQAGAQIDLGTDLVDSLSYNAGSQVLSFFYSGVQTGALKLPGGFQTSDFRISSTSGTKTLTTTLACFAAGTRISTDLGPVAVELLAVGDLVVTSAGLRPIIWLGRRAVDCAQHVSPRAIWPVKIGKHAFAPGQPGCDLLLSPDHAMFAQGVLIPAAALVNGGSVVQVPVDRITYFHVELEAHSVIFAEALAVESYRENGNREDFDAAPVPHPQAAAGSGEPVAPVVRQGPVVDRVRASLKRVYNLAAI